MPYQERLTWDGVALHAGGLPGYPESHGCVHLPSQFADDLFQVTHLGMTVVVVNDHTAPADVVHPGALVPISATSGEMDIQSRLAAGEKWRWEPEKSPDGPVSMMVSLADQRENTGHSMTVMGAGNPNFTKDQTQHRTKAAGQS